MSFTVIPLRLIVTHAEAEEGYREYVAECAHMLAKGELHAESPDDGYRTGVPEPWEQYLADWIKGILDELLENHANRFGHRIETR